MNRAREKKSKRAYTRTKECSLACSCAGWMRLSGTVFHRKRVCINAVQTHNATKNAC